MTNKDVRPQIDPLAVSEKTAAELLGLSPSSLEKDRAHGHLGVPSIKAGRRVIYQLADLRSWLAEHRFVPQPDAYESNVTSAPSAPLDDQGGV
jgi:hypothetical protein